MSKIEIFVKNRIFAEKSKFWAKLVIFVKNRIFAKSQNFGQSYKFLSKIESLLKKSKLEIFAKNQIFAEKSKFWTKNRNYARCGRDSPTWGEINKPLDLAQHLENRLFILNYSSI